MRQQLSRVQLRTVVLGGSPCSAAWAAHAEGLMLVASLAGLAMFEDGATLDEVLIEMGEDEE